MSRENCEQLLACVRRRFAALVEFSDRIERIHDEADEAEKRGDYAEARLLRARIERAWNDECLVDEEFGSEFRRLRDATIYSEFSDDEWAEIRSLDAAKREFAFRLALRELKHRED